MLNHEMIEPSEFRAKSDQVRERAGSKQRNSQYLLGMLFRFDKPDRLLAAWEAEFERRFVVVSEIARTNSPSILGPALESFWRLPYECRLETWREPAVRYWVTRLQEAGGQVEPALSHFADVLIETAIGTIYGAEVPTSVQVHLVAKGGRIQPPQLEVDFPLPGVDVAVDIGRAVGSGLEAHTDSGLVFLPEVPSRLTLNLEAGVRITCHPLYHEIIAPVLTRLRPLDWQLADSRPDYFPSDPKIWVRLGAAIDFSRQIGGPVFDTLRRYATVLVPIVSPVADGVSIAECRGAVHITVETDPWDTADHYFHEAAHNRLDSFLDLVGEIDNEPGLRYRSPWRTDRRPLLGLFHGVYSFGIVAEVIFRASGSENGDSQFGRALGYLDQVKEALATIRNSFGVLSPIGGMLATEMEAWVGSISDRASEIA